MLIGGLQKLTLIDYPGKVACIVFTIGCNFRCPYCHNRELVQPKAYPQPISEKEIFDFLSKRQGFLEGVEITGGEPTLHSDLPQFIEKIKKLGYLVKLDTNGSNPRMLKELIDKKLIDYDSTDIKGPIERYHKIVRSKIKIKDIQQSINILKEGRVDYEFRSTVVPGILDKNDFEKMGKWIKGAKRYFIQQFRPKNTLDKSYEKIKPYPPEKLYEFAEIMKKYVKEVKIRGI